MVKDNLVNPLILLDTASLYYRAFHSLPESLVAKDGTPINAIRGLLDRIARLHQDRSPRAIVACWDTEWRPQWRVDLIPTYKSHRLAEIQEDPDDEVSAIPDLLAEQIPIIAEVLEALGIPVIGGENHEADDIIGTYANTESGPIEIVTGDRDLFQLIDDTRGVSVLYTSTGEMNQYQELQVLEKYGVRASQYVDFSILRGDASDGLPGVKGVGEKTAAKLIQTFGTLREVINAAQSLHPEIKPRIANSITDSQDYLAAAAKVVPVVRNLALDPVSKIQLEAAPQKVLLDLGEELNISALMQRLIQILEIR
jgi:5'-3' exonuclease